MAELATPGLVRELERRDAIRARHEAKNADEGQAIAQRLEATQLRFDANAGPTGSLFGSVTATNVADKLWEDMKIRVDRRKLGMDAIKRVGRYTVPVEVFGDVTATLRVIVVPEGGELPPEEDLEAAAAVEAEEQARSEAAAQAEAAAAEAAIEAVVEQDETAEADEPEADRSDADQPRADQPRADQPDAAADEPSTEEDPAQI
jgi:large subunit ribosomal protein L9